MTRRELGRVLLPSIAGCLLPSIAWSADEIGDLDVREMIVAGAGGRHRMRVFVPRHLAPGERVPLVVLIHGLGETSDEQLGAAAWSDRYGLVSAYERLRRPPVARTSKRNDWTDARLAEVNALLTARPFRGFAILCPAMPLLRGGQLEAWGQWLTQVALPRARQEAVDVLDVSAPMIGGCSLGGYVSLEIFLRYPALFRAWCGIQTAIGEASAAAYANRIAQMFAQVGFRDLHLETSSGDPFRAANVALANALAAQRIPRDLRVIPGPHDQPWLREAGTIEALLWLDRRGARESFTP